MIKIDRSFIQAMHLDQQRRSIVRTIIQLADTLNKAVVAEGVEEWTQQETRDTLGGDLLQGYRFAQPLPLPDALHSVRPGQVSFAGTEERRFSLAESLGMSLRHASAYSIG